jgi:hypothetical protein
MTYVRRDGPPSRAQSRAPSRFDEGDRGPPVIILPSRVPSRAPSRTPSRYEDDEIVVEEEHSDPESRGRGSRGGGDRASRYRRDQRDDVVIEDFGPIGRPPPPVIKGERYPSRVEYERGNGDARGGGRGRGY